MISKDKQNEKKTPNVGIVVVVVVLMRLIRRILISKQEEGEERYRQKCMACDSLLLM